MSEIHEQKAEILAALDGCDFVYFDNRRTLSHWWYALKELIDERRIDCHFNEIEEQYGRLEIRKHTDRETTLLTDPK